MKRAPQKTGQAPDKRIGTGYVKLFTLKKRLSTWYCQSL